MNQRIMLNLPYQRQLEVHHRPWQPHQLGLILDSAGNRPEEIDGSLYVRYSFHRSRRFFGLLDQRQH